MASLFGVLTFPHRALAKAKKDMYRAMGCNDTGVRGGPGGVGGGRGGVSVGENQIKRDFLEVPT
jgi:hypothetical protein